MTDESTTGASAAAPAARRSLAGRLKWPLIVIIALVALYVVSPYYSFWRFTQALKAGDQQRFESMVDFRSVRESLKKQLRAKLDEGKDPNAPKKEPSLLGLSDQFAPRLIDALVDTYVTPTGLAALLADMKNPNAPSVPGASDSNAEPAAPADATALAQSPEVRAKLGWSSVRYAFFTGARDFLIDVDGTKLRFRFSKARWILKTVEPDLSELQL